MGKYSLCMNCMEIMGEYDVCSHCGWVKTDKPNQLFQLSPGIKLNGRYLIGMAFAVGGFGILYHGYDLTLNMHVAIKEFYPNGIVNRSPGDKNLIIFSGDKKRIFASQLKRFLEEAKILAKFSHDPNFVKVIDFFEENRTAYIVMEYLNGCSLTAYLKENPILEESKAISIIMPVVDALIAMHQQNVIHRDVNPNNIFITKTGQTKLLDLGAARLSNEENNENLTVIVTPGYAPVEQYKKEEKQGGFTDVYSVAATLYRMLTGIEPEESTDRIIKDELKKPNEVCSKISQELGSVILRGMAPEAKLRFKSMEEFKKALLSNRKVKLPQEIAQQRKRWRIGVICAVLILVCGVAGLYYKNSQNADKAILDEETIGNAELTVAVCDEENIDSSIYSLIVNEFNQQYENIRVNIEIIAATQYESAIQTGNYNIYRSDIVTMDNNADLFSLFDSLDLDNYGILKNNEEQLLEERKIPTGFSVSTLYLNRYLCEDIAEISTNEIDFNNFYSLQSSYDGLNKFNHCYISPSQFLQITQSAGIEALTYVPEMDSQLKMIEELNEKASASGSNVFEMLGNNTLLSYLGSSNDYRKIQQYNGGNYMVDVPLSNQVILADYTQLWSVVEKNEKTDLAAMLFLSFLLSDVSQNYLYLQNDCGLPVNETTLSYYSDEFLFVSDRINDVKIVENYEQLGVQLAEETKGE